MLIIVMKMTCMTFTIGIDDGVEHAGDDRLHHGNGDAGSATTVL
jgi:hypothetical protein